MHILENVSLIETADYSVFASTDFDPNEYANATLAGEPYPPQPQVGASAGGTKASAPKPGLEPAKEDISVAIAKLNFGIEDVSKQIKNVVSNSLSIPSILRSTLFESR